MFHKKANLRSKIDKRQFSSIASFSKPQESVLEKSSCRCYKEKGHFFAPDLFNFRVFNSCGHSKV